MAIRSLPDLNHQVKAIERALEDLKKVQRVGVSSLKGYKTFSNDLYDWSYLAPADIQRFRLTFTHDTAREGAILRLKAFYRISNGNVMDDPVEGFGTSPDWQFDYELESFNDTTTTWILIVLNNVLPTTLTGYVKFFFDGTDTGTYSIVAI